MELLERLRELVAELLDRPIRDRPPHPAIVASLLRQPLLLEQAAVLVLAATTAWARCVPGSLRHRPERYERRRTASRPGTGGPARYSAWPTRPCRKRPSTPARRSPARGRPTRAENERLRTLLKLAQRTKTILDASKPEPPPSGPGSPASAAEKVALMRGLFRGRDDVYALRWESPAPDRAAMCPRSAAAGARTARRSYLHLTDEAIEEHLRGRESIGVYPLLTDDTCWFLACDLDGRTWQLDAARAPRGVR